MKRFFVSVLAFGVLTTLTAGAQDSPKKSKTEPPMRGIHWAKGFAHHGGGSPDMTWHNGAILTTAATQAIFWGTSWATYTGDKITGMDTWYEGFGGSNYAATSDEYTGTNGQVTSSTSYGGHVVDTTTASGGSKTSAILAEVSRTVITPFTPTFRAVTPDTVPITATDLAGRRRFNSPFSGNWMEMRVAIRNRRFLESRKV